MLALLLSREQSQVLHVHSHVHARQLFLFLSCSYQNLVVVVTGHPEYCCGLFLSKLSFLAFLLLLILRINFEGIVIVVGENCLLLLLRLAKLALKEALSELTLHFI